MSMNVADIWIIAAGAIIVAWFIWASNTRDCPECKGTGTFTSSEEISIPCYRCGGKGRI